MHSAADRRQFLLSLPALVFAPKMMAQTSTAPIRVRGLNHVTLTVSDIRRSLDFYQALFGMPVQARQGPTTVSLRIGSGPQHMALTAGGATAKPSINHFC